MVKRWYKIALNIDSQSDSNPNFRQLFFWEPLWIRSQSFIKFSFSLLYIFLNSSTPRNQNWLINNFFQKWQTLLPLLFSYFVFHSTFFITQNYKNNDFKTFEFSINFVAYQKIHFLIHFIRKTKVLPYRLYSLFQFSLIKYKNLPFYSFNKFPFIFFVHFQNLIWIYHKIYFLIFFIRFFCSWPLPVIHNFNIHFQFSFQLLFTLNSNSSS